MVLLIGITLSFTGIAFAQEDTTQQLAKDFLNVAAGNPTIVSTIVVKVINTFLYFTFILTGLLADIAGTIAQISIETSIVALQDITIVKEGWEASRDLANISFIFILLTIAIATILRKESYGMKRLLPTLILVAIFINFSLLITQFVIQPTNLLGSFFLKKIDNEGANFATTIKKSLYLSSVLAVTRTEEAEAKPAPSQGEYGPVLIAAKKIATFVLSTPPVKTVKIILGLYDFRSGKELKNDTGVAIISILSIIVFLIAAFVFLTIAFLVTIRTLILMFLMVLAPLAFLFHVLPATQGYARQWWNMLLSQSFFLPIMLFLVLLAVKLSAGISQKLDSNTSILDNVHFLYSFFLIAGFLLLALITAQKMGAYGATMTMRLGGAARQYATGAAGRIAFRYTAAPVARAIAESETSRRLAGRSQLYGGIQQTLEKIAKPATEAEKRRKGYSLDYMRRLEPGARAEYFASASAGEQRESLKDLSASNIAAMVEDSPDKNRAIIEAQIKRLKIADREKYDRYIEIRAKAKMKNPKRLAEEFSGLNVDLKKSILDTNREDIQNLANASDGSQKRSLLLSAQELNKQKVDDILSVTPQFADEVGRSPKEAVEKIDFKKISESEAKSVMENVALHATNKQRGEILQRGGGVANNYLASIHALDKSRNRSAVAIGDAIEKAGNTSAAVSIKRDKVIQAMHDLT